jgi:RNA polymerase sigma-70 factor (ECF subfamily)
VGTDGRADHHPRLTGDGSRSVGDPHPRPRPLLRTGQGCGVGAGVPGRLKLGGAPGLRWVMDDFEVWYPRVRTPMHSALSAWCGSADAAADALDEAFVRGLERWSRVSVMSSPEGWIWRTATNHVRRVARRRGRELDILVAGRSVTGEGHEPAPADIDLQRAILQLAARQRTAVVLHYLADLSTAEVAAAMGVATGTVHATLHQARDRLAVLLAEPVLLTDDDPAPAPDGSPPNRPPDPSSPLAGGEPS